MLVFCHRAVILGAPNQKAATVDLESFPPEIAGLLDGAVSFRAKEQRLLRAIVKTRFAIDHVNAHVGRLDWDAKMGRMSPDELRMNRGLREHEAGALAGLRGTLAQELAALAVIRADERGEPHPPAGPNYKAQERYRARNREVIAAKDRKRRAINRMLS